MAKKKKTGLRMTTGRLMDLIKDFPPDTPVVGIYCGSIVNMDGVQEIMFHQGKADKRQTHRAER